MNKNRVKKKPNVIGEGSYGCVIDPPLACEDSSINTEDKIAKVLKKKDLDNEMKQYENLRKIEGIDKYAIIPSDKECKPKKKDLDMIISDDKCKKLNKEENRENVKYSSYLMSNGGIDLVSVMKKIDTRKNNVDRWNDNEIHNFFESIPQLFDALIFLKEKKYAHII